MNWRMTVAFAALLLAGVVQRAQAGDGVVALQTADASCPDDSGNIYVDCGNGTVTDNRTGLTWLANADCYGLLNWYEAVEIVASLSDIQAGSIAAAEDCGLSDGSSSGEWRLPSVAEWKAMIDNALGNMGDPDCTALPPTITVDSGDGCWVRASSSFSGVQSSKYWSSTTFVGTPTVAWHVHLNFGSIFLFNKAVTTTHYVWPVRGGQ